MAEVLSYQNELIVAHIRKVFGLAENFLHGSGLELSSDSRNDTICAAVVAAVGYKKVGPVPACGNQSLLLGRYIRTLCKILGVSPRLAFLYGLDYIEAAVRPQNGINLGEFFSNLFFEEFG